VSLQFDVPEGVPIVAELAKLIKLSGRNGPTTVAKFQSDTDRQQLSVYMSWDANGELEIK
jgi:hypothetical protein